MGFLEIAKSFSLETVFIRLVCAMLCGTAVGVERELRNKRAGLKTHALVCIGAAMCMIVSEYIGISRPELSTDAARIGANVVTGVGFLGAATIITGHNEVRGLTTAAGVWGTACIGLACGAGFIEGAMLAVAFILFVLCVYPALTAAISGMSRAFEVYAELQDVASVKEFLGELRELNTGFDNLRVRHTDMGGDGVALTLSAVVPNAGDKPDIIYHLKNLPYVVYLEES